MDFLLQLGQRLDYTRALLVGVLILVRLMPIILLVPFLGGKLVPAELKIGLGASLSILIYPFVERSLSGPLPIAAGPYLLLLMKELFVGVTIGFLAAETFYAMEMAGRALDVARGSNMAEVQVPELPLRASPLGDFMFQLLLVVLIGFDGHHVFIESLFESFRVVPVDKFPAMSHGFAQVGELFAKTTGHLWVISMTLVFPGLLAAFLTDVIFGILNRVAPQINAYFMAMPVKAVGGMLALFVAFGITLRAIQGHAGDILVNVRHLLELYR